MRLTKVLERQTGYIIFIRSSRVSFYVVQCAIFTKLFFILIQYYHISRLFSGREMPKQNSRLFAIVGTLHITTSRLIPSSLNQPVGRTVTRSSLERKFKSRAGQIETSVANGSPPLRHFCCVALAHDAGMERLNSLHAST